MSLLEEDERNSVKCLKLNEHFTSLEHFLDNFLVATRSVMKIKKKKRNEETKRKRQ